MVVSKKKKKLIPGFFSAAEKTVRVKATLMPERYFKKKEEAGDPCLPCHLRIPKARRALVGALWRTDVRAQDSSKR